jgi:outer membrane protein assembly factor BamB
MKFVVIRRWSVLALAVLAAAAMFSTRSAWAQRLGREIIPQSEALRHGLTRAWVTQVEVDRSRGRIAHVSLEDGLLMVQTDQATIQVMDAETRRTLWIAHVGRPNYPVTPPAANDRFVVTNNGAHLYLFERDTGRLVWEKRLNGVPSAGVAISHNRAYVPLTSGVVMSYLLPDPKEDDLLDPLEKLLKDQPLVYQGKGMAESAPIVTSTNVVWATSQGNVYSVTPEDLAARFKFSARGAITAPLSYRTPFVYAASRDGYVYAIREERGYASWKFSSGNPVVEQPVVIGDSLFLIPETGGLFRLSVETGVEQWSVPGVYHFVAASPTRLYTVDLLGRLVILDAQSGARLGSLETSALDLKLVNDQTDRIYLGTRTGLIQCLHEVQLSEPVIHRARPPAPVAPDEPAEGEEPETDEPDSEEPDSEEPEAEMEEPADTADEAADPFD